MSHMPMLAMLTGTIIQERFPGRGVLTPPEVAEVWRGERTREAVGAIRKRLSRGTLIPGLKQNGGRWEIPAGSLIKAIERLDAGGDDEDRDEDDQPVHPQAASPSGTRKRAIGPRMSDTVGFWDEVFRELELLDAQWRRAALAGVAIWGWQRVSIEKRKATAARVVAAKRGAVFTNEEAAALCGRDVRTLHRWRKEKVGPTYRVEMTKENKMVVVYPRGALLRWLKSQPEEQLALDVMVWSVDTKGRVAKKGERDAGSVFDLLRAEHTNRESMALAMVLYRQQVADELDEAAWRLAALPAQRQQERTGGL